jgi:outer membrane protein
MKKLLFIPVLLAALLAALPVLAVEGVAIIDMRTAIISTQVAQDTFEALQEDSEYAGSVEQATLIQSERQSLLETLQKDSETLSPEEIAGMQKSIQDKSTDLEFHVGKIRAKEQETADKIFRDLTPSFQKILSELIAAKEIKVLLGKENVLFNDPSLDLTNTVTSMLDVAAAAGADKK